jgi:hypothetical protein
MTGGGMPEDVVEFSYMETDKATPLKPGHWTWRVIENRRCPVVSCSTCGAEAYFPKEYTFASDGLIGSPGGRGFRCRSAPACAVKGRYLLRDYKAHARMVD